MSALRLVAKLAALWLALSVAGCDANSSYCQSLHGTPSFLCQGNPVAQPLPVCPPAVPGETPTCPAWCTPVMGAPPSTWWECDPSEEYLSAHPEINCSQNGCPGICPLCAANWEMRGGQGGGSATSSCGPGSPCGPGGDGATCSGDADCASCLCLGTGAAPTCFGDTPPEVCQ